RAAVNRYLWDDENGCFRDYDWRREQLALFSAASIVTLYVGLARFALPGYAAYAAMKGAMEVLTRYQAKELGGRGISVNIIA
ncbi:SDR family oxidoreductase, partial [Klebsiella pneumoniae]|uniref:SDR family oxidoreductase n=1 Tax=Klebsiella pneumoniae TaxID=573 RepID=UPI0030DA6D76